MTIWTILKHFNYNQLWQLFLLALKYPVYVFPTLKATIKTFQISRDEFPKTHGKKGKGNAFRHALWNLLICYECYKWRKDKDRVTAWAKIITNKHEELSPNHPLDKAMDLHNNDIGRILFQEFQFKDVEVINHRLKSKLSTAKQILTIEDIEDYKDELIYISEYDYNK